MSAAELFSAAAGAPPAGQIFQYFLGTAAAGALLITFGLALAGRRERSSLFRSLGDDSRFRILFYEHPQPMWVFEPPTLRFLEVNQAAVDQYGYSREEFLSMRLSDIRPPEDVPRLIEDVRTSADHHSAGFWRHRTKDGRLIDVEISTHALHFWDRPARLVVAKDVTERWRAEAQLKQREEQYRVLVQSANSIILRLDGKGRITFMNAFGLQFFGYEEADILGKPVVGTIVPPVDSEGRDLRDMIRAAIRDPESYAVNENENVCRDGRRVWVSWHNRMVRDESGQPSGMLSIGVDVTDLRKTQAALRDSERQFRSLFENSPIGIYRTTPDGRILMANPTLVGFLGFSSFQELSARNLEKDGFISGYPRSRFKEQLEEKGELIGYESPWVKQDGSVIILRENARVVRAEDGRVLYYEGTTEDITQRREIEKRLNQTEKLQAIGRLSGGVAHDFNNLLQASLNLIEIMRNNIHDRGLLSEGLNELDQHIERGAQLSRQLLLFSRLETSRRERVDLNDSVRNAVALIRRLFPENIAIRVSLADQPLPLEGDPGQVEQVVVNLAVNAADAMPDGGVLTVKTFSREPGEVCLCIADTGTGIPKDVQEHLFEPFFSTKDPSRGTGLGLSVVHGILSQHGGAVNFQTEEGRGSKFIASWPRMVQTGLPANHQEEEAPGLRAENILARVSRILLVEDEDPVREGLAELLRVQGFEVLTAADGKQAAELADSAPDLLLSDFMLPDTTGLEVAWAMRSKNPGLPVIIMSGYAQDSSFRKKVLEGDLHFLPKPFRSSDLLKQVAQALEEEG